MCRASFGRTNEHPGRLSEDTDTRRPVGSACGFSCCPALRDRAHEFVSGFAKQTRHTGASHDGFIVRGCFHYPRLLSSSGVAAILPPPPDTASAFSSPESDLCHEPLRQGRLPCPRDAARRYQNISYSKIRISPNCHLKVNVFRCKINQ